MLRVSGKNLDMGEAMRQHVETRVTSTIGKYFDGAVNGHVVVEREGSGFRADCTLHLSSGVTLQAEGRGQEPYASFEQAADRIEKRLRRYKRRLKEHHGRENGSAAGVVDGMLSHYVLEAPDSSADEAPAYAPVVIAERTAKLREMPVSRAVEELDFSGAPVIVFRHASHGRVNVVYRRPDGHVGWVDPGAEAAGEVNGKGMASAPGLTRR